MSSNNIQMQMQSQPQSHEQMVARASQPSNDQQAPAETTEQPRFWMRGGGVIGDCIDAIVCFECCKGCCECCC